MTNESYIHLFDPSFDEKGHFSRFQKHYEKLLKNEGCEPKVVKNRIENIQSKCSETKNPIKKLILFLRLFGNYWTVLMPVRKERILFLSQGRLPFWIFTLFWVRRYSLCLISTQLFENKMQGWIFKKVVKRAEYVIFTNEYHRDKYLQRGLVIHDRVITYKKRSQGKLETDQIKILGHINKKRNPLEVLNLLKDRNFKIYGVVDSAMLSELANYKNLEIMNGYLSETKYQEEISKGIHYIPLKKEYSDHFISGVLFDIIGAGGTPVLDFHPLYANLFNSKICLSVDQLKSEIDFENDKWEANFAILDEMNQISRSGIKELKEKFILK